MKISTEIQSAARIVGEEKTIELLAKAGFDAFDFSMFSMCNYDWGKKCCLPSSHPLSGENYLSFSAKLKRIGLENGIVCNQSHAPFPTACAEVRSFLKRAIECTAEAGGEICVVHPDNNKSPEENAELYLELLPFAKACGVKLAAENMWNWDSAKGQSSFAACATDESFLAHLNAVNDDFLVACLDLGHAEMKGSGSGAVAMIEALGPHLKALHIHDNDRLHDAHQIPFSMEIDFAAIVKALKKIGYDGYFTLEADSYLRSRGYTPENLSEGLANLAQSAKRLVSMFDAAEKV